MPAYRRSTLLSLFLSPMLAAAHMAPVLAADNGALVTPATPDRTGCTGTDCGASEPSGGTPTPDATARIDGVQGGSGSQESNGAGLSGASANEAAPEGHGDGMAETVLEGGGSDGGDIALSACCNAGGGASMLSQASGDGSDGTSPLDATGQSGSGS